jgi:hypothetical protein
MKHPSPELSRLLEVEVRSLHRQQRQRLLFHLERRLGHEQPWRLDLAPSLVLEQPKQAAHHRSRRRGRRRRRCFGRLMLSLLEHGHGLDRRGHLLDLEL